MPFEPPDLLGGDLVRTRNHLPHWRLERATYFVTFRLADSIPQVQLRLWQEERESWLQAHGIGPERSLDSLAEAERLAYHRRFTVRFHEWLDAGEGECWLRRPECAEVVAGALRHFDGQRYALDAFVVMPNHSHALLTPQEGWELSAVLHSWKSFSAHEINRRLNRRGPVWQKESYDHIVRSEEQFAHYRRYIRQNPVKARLRPGEYLWWDALGEP